MCDQEFPSISKLDTGSYFCEAFNGEGAPQRGDAVHMEVRKLHCHCFQIITAHSDTKRQLQEDKSRQRMH